MSQSKLTDKEFELFKGYIHKISGIFMKPEKKVLVESRLAKRLRHFGCGSYKEYYDILQRDDIEQQAFIDIITTNETSFFREPHHFEFLKNIIVTPAISQVRIWSAACSIGAEAYSAAMVCDESLTPRRIGFEIVCSDINSDVLNNAQTALYTDKFIPQIPVKYLKKYCLKGSGEHEGNFIIDDTLKSHFLFRRLNLLEKLGSDLGEFDVIFLRNMLIYFDDPEKKAIVENVTTKLKKGGYLFIGHSESLFRITECVEQVKPTIYIKN
jgi:chemotaxis protein methyltransferase CheR